MIKKLKDLFENIFLKLFSFNKKRKKITDYDLFIEYMKDTLALNVDFRAEYNTEEIKVIINPLKPIRTPKKPKKEVKESIELKEEEEEEYEK